MASTELLDGLNDAMNREISTFLRYIQQGARVKGAPWNSVRNLYLGEVQDEVGHAQYLANKIVMLGGTPRVEPDLTPPPADVRDMLMHDIEQELLDVRGYLRLAAMAERDGLADLKVKMEEQAADEARHAEEMRRALG